MAIANRHIAELLAREAESADGHVRRALRGASRAALFWPVEAPDLARTATLREMAGAAGARGLEYVAVTDHTESLRIARGSLTDSELPFF